MRVLLVNDDGVYSHGIQALRATLEEAEDWEVYVVAPDRQRSASGHAITLHKPLYLDRVDIPGARSPVYAVSGTPADCTKIGLLAVLPGPCDLVISGINRGGNLGFDVLYSGTVSAAIEGVIMGVPAIAVSLAAWEEPDYGPAAAFTARLAEVVARKGLPRGVLLNVNVPPLPAERIKGVALTVLSRRSYRDRFEKRFDPRGRPYYWLAGEPVEEPPSAETDVGAVRAGYISITPLHLQLSDHETLGQLQAWKAELEAGLGGRAGTPARRA
ncbi:5'-nucleotidase; exopolyphosphatase; 3'-nucleotidase [Thermaerobacter marianensis DSM 12885]|uniref:5'-nucleotidase SurE n=1 Tax=Thermaerobacter marianensis (strain ATCC 700841 / DSM 12885 / JCM 10246 / 7p75a) TaxID=644966 RepID=E6SK64_THEM7|nr:5'/3'-nucleotidase SurE [Thermaerobacter marianensis]ADU51205.1 5'-nucleotidase; exopolyphosphatase; 3'-nucleotidase [Thermaerobacter marianensis DSM 12885]